LRTWRSEPGRAWGAAVLSTFLMVGAIILCGVGFLGPPDLLIDRLGRDGGGVLHYCGLAVLLSSVSLGIVWAIPGRRDS
jgi:hypothetical protein